MQYDRSVADCEIAKCDATGLIVRRPGAVQIGPNANIFTISLRVASRRVAGCATPASSAGHATAGAETVPKLTLPPNHSVGADHAPQSGLARLTSRMSRRVSSGVCGRPPRGPDLLRQ